MWVDEHFHPDRIEKALGRKLERALVHTDLDPTDDGNHADAMRVLLVFEGGFTLSLAGSSGFITATTLDESAFTANEVEERIVTIEPPPDPSTVPAGAQGCTCIDEPGEDPMCRIHGNPEGGVPE